MKSKIAVVGGGVIGLSSAYKILLDNPDVDLTVFYDEMSPNTTADVSAGWIYPSKVNGKDAEIRKWFDLTFEHLSALHKAGNSAEMGISPISGFVVDPPKFNLEVCGKWMRPMSADEKLTFLPDWQKRYKSMHFLTTWICDCSFYLPWLAKKVECLGGKLVQKLIKSFDELASFDIVVNCSGYGAKDLTSDPNLYQVKGQVFNVEAPWIKHFYWFGEDLYVLPKLNDVVLGGTRDEIDKTKAPNKVESERIWKGCHENVPSLQGAKFLKESVGFRPTRRPSIKLEMEKGRAKDQHIIHNYGHGGSGVTLHWGCAIEVSHFVKNALAHSKSKL